MDLGEAEPRAFSDLLRREEGLAGAGEHLGRHALARVARLEGDGILPVDASGECPDPERSAFRHRVAGVRSKVDESDLQLGRVNLDHPEILSQVELAADVAAEGSSEHLIHVAHEMIEVDVRKKRLAPAEGQKLRREKAPLFDGLQRRRDQAAASGLVLCPGEEIETSENDGQEIVESWAMPPVSWPSASMRCAFASIASEVSRSRVSPASCTAAKWARQVRARARPDSDTSPIIAGMAKSA